VGTYSFGPNNMPLYYVWKPMRLTYVLGWELTATIYRKLSPYILYFSLTLRTIPYSLTLRRCFRWYISVPTLIRFITTYVIVS